MNPESRTILTVGHSTHPIKEFIAILTRHNVTAIADVRSMPYSRFNPQFNRNDLEQTLKASDIRYVFLGRELGARSDDPACYINGRVQYDRIARTELFQNGIQRVISGSEKYRIALMCAEKEPLDCHRTLLVARALIDQGLEVMHILGNGKLESYEQALNRLLVIFGLNKDDLFLSREDRISQALARQEERIAYVDEKLAAESSGGEL